uniref:Uncharacterized protein n=1 Tax=Zea mays TaxID=4577 RepID=B6UG83_MAIZE|nr:hypothetical protein [Zea mays]
MCRFSGHNEMSSHQWQKVSSREQLAGATLRAHHLVKMRFGWFKVNVTFSCSCFNHAEGVVVLGILNNSTVRKQEMSWSPRRQCSIEIFFCFALINFCPLVDFSCVFEVALCVICPRICSMCVCFITHSLHVCCYDCGHPVRFQEHC